MYPLLITKEKHLELKDTPFLKRAYFYKDADLWVAIDNRKGKAWEKKFSSMRGCTKWLKGTWV